jgi:hypothetical protein
MRHHRYLIGIWLAVVSTVYLGSYFLIVQPRLPNPFISFNGRPLPLAAHYRVSGPVVKALYEPLVRLDHQVFPKRWEWPSAQECRQYLSAINHNMDRFQLYEELVRAQAIGCGPDREPETK